MNDQLHRYFRVLWARGMRTTFQSKSETIERVLRNLFPKRRIHPTVKVAVEGAIHTEYELRTARKLIPGNFGGKTKSMLTGILDLVIQSNQPLRYPLTWECRDVRHLEGEVVERETQAVINETEIWDYKGTRSDSPYLSDFVRQLLTYANLFREKTGYLPARCVLFFVNEPDEQQRLVAIPISENTVQRAEKWTIDQVRELQRTILRFERSPNQIQGGDITRRHNPPAQRIDKVLKKQCTACGQRFDCQVYIARLGRSTHPDVSIVNVAKN